LQKYKIFILITCFDKKELNPAVNICGLRR